jgi:DNA-binding transcriptional regulator/RsmH inhibitor MraZ
LNQEYRDDLIAKELWDEEKYRQYQDEQEEKFAEYVLREADFKRYKKEKKKTR